MGALLGRLRRAAVAGAVPESAFLAGVSELSLDYGERERLRVELARLGLPVRDAPLHTESDKRNGEKVAPDREENVFARIRSARNLLSRYEDADGRVTQAVVDGVTRLAGLTAREAALLLAQAPVGGGGTEAVAETEAGSAGSEQEAVAEPGPPDGAPNDSPDGGPEDVPDEELTADLPPGHLADAVAAAHAVLERDRHERRPGSRLLDAQTEVGLAALLRGGPDRIGVEPTEDELKALAPEDLRIRARDCLVVHNQRLVHSLVRAHLEQGLDYDDLVQHGCLGLLRAARKFDATKGFKFSTYATWWIRQAMTRAVADEGAVIRIPVHMHEQVRKVARAERTLSGQGRPATAADVAVACDLTVQKVEEIRKVSRRTDSLDRVIGDGATLADFVGRAHTLPSVEHQVLQAQYRQDVLNVADTFTEREARILVRRLGLDGDDTLTLDELGREFGVTRERIRQIERKTRPLFLERLRKNGLVGVDAVCEEGERAAELAAEAERTARFARATRAARTARARLALRRLRAERLVRIAREQAPAAALPAKAAMVEQPGEQRGARIEATEPANTLGAVDEGLPDQQMAADWEEACRLAKAPVDQVGWLAEYVRTAVGDAGLVSLLGQSGADLVARNVRDGAPLSRPVLTALELLRRVLDAVAAAGRRPEDFFERTAESLRGVAPRAYVEGSPLVNGEARLAVRDALREFIAAVSQREESQAVLQVSEQAAGEQEAEQIEQGAVEPQETEQAGPDPEPEPAMAMSRAGVRNAERPARAPRTTADWEQARTLTQPPLGGGAVWLAEYALLALGHPQLSVLLGPSAIDDVVRAARERGTLDRSVVEALELLKEICDAVKHRTLRPERFFERPADALSGATPRTYLAVKPLVRAESRLAVREALREFVVARPVHTEPAPADGDTETGTAGTPAAAPRDPRPAPSDAVGTPAERPSVDGEALLAAARLRHQGDTARLVREHKHRLDEERRNADRRVAAVRAEAERRLDALEDELLHRADRSRDRHAQHVRRQAEERLAHLRAQHQEAYEAALHRAERAEEAARQVVGTGRRADELEQRLRDYRDGAEARITGLETRLRQAREAAAGLEARLRTAEETAAEQERAATSARHEDRRGAQVRIAEAEARLREAEAALAQRELFVEAARRSAEEAEQRAAQRIAQSEHDAWLRVTDLQTQLSNVQAELAAVQAQEAARNRPTLRDRWRRS
ncbi:sigma-70 family RNA polymerase sigma factor [Streptomyces sp. Tu 4128]|uniref:sigma-70 family RNA polymerase sigma factor n=1 Tax=Streptomyces sp. Tu 4128 TaxID=1120314 RepID=UPI0023F9B2D5|nr:sigma-70 family RNA polymerase sigma factor [Streptomyces sp. Tu 4128]